MAEDRYDVVVVGGGPTGSAAAWALARRGRSVLLVDDDRPAVTGVDVVRLGYADTARTGLALLSHQWWQVLEQESGMPLVRLTPCVEHGPVEALRPLVETLLVTDVPFEYLTGPEAELRWPGLRFDDRAVVQPVAGTVDAAAALRTLRDQAVLAGAHVTEAERVSTVETGDDDVRLRVAGGPDGERTVVAGAVVLAGAPELVADLLAGVVGVPAVEPVSEVRATGRRPADATGPVFLHRADASAHASARGDLGTDDDYPASGARGTCTDDGTVELVRHAPDDGSAEADLRAYVATWLPGVTLDDADVRTVERVTSPVVVDRVGRVVVGSGADARGVALAPGVGHVLADLADEALGTPVPPADVVVDRAAFALVAAPEGALAAR